MPVSFGKSIIHPFPSFPRFSRPARNHKGERKTACVQKKKFGKCLLSIDRQFSPLLSCRTSSSKESLQHDSTFVSSFAELYGHSSSQSHSPFVCGLSKAPLHSRPYLLPRLSPRRHLSRRARADFRSVSVTVAAAHLFRQQWMDLRMSGMSGWRPEEEYIVDLCSSRSNQSYISLPQFPPLKSTREDSFLKRRWNFTICVSPPATSVPRPLRARGGFFSSFP